MKKLFTLGLSALALPTVAFADFTDVPSSHTHSQAIDFIADAEIVHGHDDGSFQPDTQLNRADFIKIMVNAAYDQGTIDACNINDLPYSDVMPSDWHAPFVCVATNENIVQGYANGTYGGQNHINYAEASKIIVETFNVPTMNTGGQWHEKYVQAIQTNNAVPRSGISPWDNITRGEMAQILFNLDQNNVIDIASKTDSAMNIVETAVATDILSTLAAAVTAGELVDTLSSEGPFTVFAPTNDAFAEIQSTVDTLLMPENKADLQNVLTYHVVSGSFMAGDLSDGMEIQTVQGQTLMVSITDGKVMINGAEVILPDVGTSNGVVHVIDGVLVPSSDEVTQNIVETAVATDSLSTLASAVTAGELVDTLSSEGPFTVFAPTNDAFAEIQSTVDTLLMPENKADLQNVLTYHVVSGSFMAGDLSDGMEIQTVQGQTLMVSITDGKVMINGAEVVLPDVGTSNGVVHVIDGVLVPQ
jgi:transforming growth factor-beta-induced protein